MLTVFLAGSDEPLGFIDIDDDTTLATARELIQSELEGVPHEFRFFIKGDNGLLIKMSLVQESKKKAKDFLPSITIKTSLVDTPQNTNPMLQVPTHSHSETSPPGPTIFKKQAEETQSVTNTHTNDNNAIISNSLHNAINELKITTKPMDEMDQMDDEALEKLWQLYFGTRTDKVRLDELPFFILRLLHVEKPDIDSDVFRAMQDLVINLGPNVFSTHENELSLEEDPKEIFYRIMKSFGPPSKLLDNVTKSLRLSYFHGNVSSLAAETMLKERPVGTFLLRLSSSQPGAFAITTKHRDHSLYHYSVQRTPDFQFKIGKDTYTSLDDLIRKNAKKLGLQHACPDSPFSKTFKRNVSDTSSYSDFNAE